MAEPITVPPRVRRSLVDLAAEVLGTMTEAEVPTRLRRVRDFAPARRARAGAAPLALSLEGDGDFRRQVAAAWRAAHPELAEAIEQDGDVPLAVDPESALAGVYLFRPEGWEQVLQRLLAQVAAQQQAAEQHEQRSPDGAGPAALHEALARARAEAHAAEAARAELAAELSTLRREHRRLRADADRVKAAARDAQRQAAEQAERLSALVAERDAQVRQAERQAQEALEQLGSARKSAREGRSLADVRARLLLDTIVESASALRRELALPPVAQTPADLVTEQLPGARAGEVAPAVPHRALAADDPALLVELLRIPKAHLIVDGYNVSMEGYGTLPLIDQRRLVVDALSALAARTFAEVTCCFDGAEVDGRAQGLVRGVRVLFSEPGTTADELIRRLVRAEPRGRMLVVVSSDREVADAALAAGARPVPSVALLRLLGAGLRDRKR